MNLYCKCIQSFTETFLVFWGTSAGYWDSLIDMSFIEKPAIVSWLIATKSVELFIDSFSTKSKRSNASLKIINAEFEREFVCDAYITRLNYTTPNATSWSFLCTRVNRRIDEWDPIRGRKVVIYTLYIYLHMLSW